MKNEPLLYEQENCKYKFNSTQENFEIFWEKYPKKVWKKPTWEKFKKLSKAWELHNFDLKNIFLWLELYCEKWKIEKTPKQFIPNPLTFLNQERYYDEIIIDESKKDKFKKILEQKKEIKKEETQEREAQQKRKELIIFYNSLSIEKRKQINNEAEDIIQKQNPKLFEKKGLFYDNYKKIIIRSILFKLI